VPYVVRPLGTIASWSLSRKAWRKRLLLSLGAMRMLRSAAAIHCTSHAEQEDVRRLGLTNPVVVPLGIDLAKNAEGRPAAPPYVLSVSRLDPKKNLETLIRSFAHVADGVLAHWRLAIAGAGPDDYSDALRQLTIECGIGARVEFAGWVEGAAKDALIAGASLFALPSYHENFGISVLEAAARGVPAVVSTGVQLSDALGRSGAAWVAGTDASSFGAALQAAMQDDKSRVVRGAAALAFAREFGWESVGRQLLSLYSAIVANPTTRRSVSSPDVVGAPDGATT
jgi:glycosyltransferase involved in cell wall biosynthesis